MYCNSTLSETHWNEDTIVGNLSLHTLGWLICGFCAIISSSCSFYLIFKHATHYTKPSEQRHIVRILLMIPIYAITSFFSYVWYWHAIYWEVGRDCYEAFAIAAFFALLCQYVAPDLRTQKEFFATMTVKPWPWPMDWFNKCCRGRIKTPRNGLTWFNINWLGVFQYCFVRIAMTITATATQAAGVYCEDSLNPIWAHDWVMLINSLAVTIAMYCLITFYVQLKQDLASQKPLLKLLCIKLVIFFSFWQMIGIDLLASANIIKTNSHLSYGDIQVGINSLLMEIEMIIFSVMHLWAFSWKDYAIHDGHYDNVTTRTNIFLGLVDAFNPLDTVKAVGRGLRWLFVGRKHRAEEAKMVVARSESKVYGPHGRAQNEEEGLGLVSSASDMGFADAYHGDVYQMGNTSHLVTSPTAYASPVDNLAVDTGYRPPRKSSLSPVTTAPAHNAFQNPAVELRMPQPHHPAKPPNSDPFAESHYDRQDQSRERSPYAALPSSSSALPYPEDNAVMMPSEHGSDSTSPQGPYATYSGRPQRVRTGSSANEHHNLLGPGSNGSSPSRTPQRGRSPTARSTNPYE